MPSRSKSRTTAAGSLIQITRAAAHIKRGLQNSLFMGNLDARRDWGYAPEYVEAMWMMLQQDSPQDYVVGTGEMHSVRQFLEWSFEDVGLDWREFVKFDPRYVRPAEVDALQADATKARRELGWEPKTTVRQLARIMVEADMKSLADRAAGVMKPVPDQAEGH